MGEMNFCFSQQIPESQNNVEFTRKYRKNTGPGCRHPHSSALRSPLPSHMLAVTPTPTPTFGS